MFKLITKPLGCLFSLFFTLLVLLALFVVAVVLGVDHFAGDAAVYAVKMRTGFTMAYTTQDVDILHGLVDFEGLTITNSSRFPAPGFVDLNQIKLAIEPKSLVQDKLVVDEVVVDLKTLTVVRTADGEYNFAAFAQALQGNPAAAQPAATPAQPATTSAAKIPPFIIHKLTIKIGTVDYCDFKSGSGKPKTYNIGYDRTFTDVTSLETLKAQLAKDFAAQGLQFLSDALISTLIDPSTYLNLANGVLKEGGAVGGQVIDAGSNATKELGGTLKKLNPF
jgi:uncharacterized protein involved in outer membrane biogenesis